MAKLMSIDDARSFAKKAEQLTDAGGSFSYEQISDQRGYTIMMTVGQNADFIEKSIKDRKTGKARYRWKAGKANDLHAKVLLESYRSYQSVHKQKSLKKAKANGAAVAHKGTVKGQIEELNERVDKIEQMVQSLAEMIG